MNNSMMNESGMWFGGTGMLVLAVLGILVVAILIKYLRK